MEFIPFLNDNASLLYHNLLGCVVSDYILQKPIMRHHFLEMVLQLMKHVSVGEETSPLLGV